MIHGPEIMECLHEQIDLCLPDELVDEPDAIVLSARYEGYIRNLGVCNKCLEIAANSYSDGIGQTGVSSDAAAAVGFARGFTIGLVLGRRRPA